MSDTRQRNFTFEKRLRVIASQFKTLFRTASLRQLFSTADNDPVNALLNTAIESPFVITAPFVRWNYLSPLLVEFVGTFFFVLVVFLTVTQPSILTPLAIGSILMVIAYAGGHISGGHYNPAVSLGAFLSGRQKLSFVFWILYTITQVLAGFLAALIGWRVTRTVVVPGPQPGFSVGMAFGMELLFTFLLVFVYLQTVTTETTKKVAGHSFYGLAVGFSVFIGVVAIGPISSGMMNPAIATGLILVAAIDTGADALEYWWLFWVAGYLGALAAVLLYHMTNRREYILNRTQGEGQGTVEREPEPEREV